MSERIVFADHLRISLFDRLKRLGHPSILPREQHRQVEGLSGLPSQIFYSGRLTDAPTTVLALRPKAQ